MVPLAGEVRLLLLVLVLFLLIIVVAVLLVRVLTLLVSLLLLPALLLVVVVLLLLLLLTTELEGEAVVDTVDIVDIEVEEGWYPLLSTDHLPLPTTEGGCCLNTSLPRGRPSGSSTARGPSRLDT